MCTLVGMCQRPHHWLTPEQYASFLLTLIQQKEHMNGKTMLKKYQQEQQLRFVLRAWKKQGGERHIAALIGKMVRDFDREEAFGLQSIQHRLDRIENRLLALMNRKEEYGEQ